MLSTCTKLNLPKKKKNSVDNEKELFWPWRRIAVCLPTWTLQTRDLLTKSAATLTCTTHPSESTSTHFSVFLKQFKNNLGSQLSCCLTVVWAPKWSWISMGLFEFSPGCFSPVWSNQPNRMGGHYVSYLWQEHTLAASGRHVITVVVMVEPAASEISGCKPGSRMVNRPPWRALLDSSRIFPGWSGRARFWQWTGGLHRSHSEQNQSWLMTMAYLRG